MTINAPNTVLSPLSRNDAIAHGYLCRIVLLLPTDGELYQFLIEENRDDEDLADTLKRLLQERYKLSCNGF